MTATVRWIFNTVPNYRELGEFFNLVFPLDPELAQTTPLKDLVDKFPEGKCSILLTKLIGSVPHLQDWLEHPTKDEYWDSIIDAKKVESIDVPIFHVGSWYDFFQTTTLQLFNLLRKNAPQKIWMGPWGTNSRMKN